MRAGNIIRRCSVRGNPTGPFMVIERCTRTHIISHVLGTAKRIPALTPKQHVYMCRYMYLAVPNDQLKFFNQVALDNRDLIEQSNITLKVDYTDKRYDKLSNTDVVVLFNAHMHKKIYIKVDPKTISKTVKQQFGKKPKLFLSISVEYIIAIES